MTKRGLYWGFEIHSILTLWTIGNLEQCVGVPVMKTSMIYYCVVVRTPVCTVQYTSVLEEVDIGTVQVLVFCCFFPSGEQ